MSRQPTTSALAEEEASTSKEDMSLEAKIGMAKKFDREMKDYAKATVKEFLGIYGYEEDVDINMDESETHKTSEASTSTSHAADKQTETESSTSTDCDNIGGKTPLVGPMQAKAVVRIDLETNEVSEITVTNMEGTSRSENESSIANPELPSSEMLKFPCSTETLVSEVETSELEIESQCEIRARKESQGELPRDMLGCEREFTSQSEMCRSQYEVGVPDETLGSQVIEHSHREVSKSQGSLGTSGQAEKVGCGGKEHLQSTEIVGLQEIDHSNNEVLTSQNVNKIQDKILELGAEFVPSGERSETPAVEKTALEEAALKSVLVRSVLTEEVLQELGKTADTFVLVDGSLEMLQSEAGSTTMTPSEIIHAISQIVPRSQPAIAVFQEHSYATTGSASEEANIELTRLQPLSISNTSSHKPVQSQKVESCATQRSDDIPSSANPSIIPSQITPTEISTNTLYVSSNIQASNNVSVIDSSLESVQSQNGESCSLQGSDDIPSTDCSDRSSERTLDSSTNTPDLHSTTELPGTLQPSTFMSMCNPSLEDEQFKTLSASPTDLPILKEKRRFSTKKHRDNETPEKRETRLKLQRERARLRRSQESETEREARREKDRIRQQLKRTKDKGKGKVDLLHTVSQTLQPSEDKFVDGGLPNPISQSTVVGEMHCSSVVGVIPMSEDMNTIPAKKPNMRDPEATNTCSFKAIVSSEGRKVIEGQQISSAESDNGESDLCQRAEKDDMQEKTLDPVILPEATEDIPEASASESSDLREDCDVTANTTATTLMPQNNSDDSCVRENREDLDMHMKIDLLNNQILSGLTESTASQTTSGLSTSQEDKDIPEHVSKSIIETSSVGPTPSLPEGHPDLPRGATDVPCEDSFICETSSVKPDDNLAEEHPGDAKGTSKLSQKEKNRDRVRRRRALETSEQREARLKDQRERVRKRRSNETDLQRENRRVRDRIRQQMKRTSEPEENRSKRLVQQRDATRRRRALESPEEKQIRRVKDRDRARKNRDSKRAGVVMN